MTTISEEEENYVRMSLLLTGVAPRAVRCKFDREFVPAVLPSTIRKEYHTLSGLKGKRVINLAQWNVLHPRNGVPDSKNFDIILMICLLRNLTLISPPSFGFDRLPPSGEISDGADLARIKYYRNYLAHLDDTKIDNSFFTLSWTDVADAMGRLGGQSIVQECQELKVKFLDQRPNKEIKVEIKQSQKEMDHFVLPPSLKEKFKLANIDPEEFHSLLLKGSYKSYQNLIYLSGPCNVGKTTLASVLTGDDIPMEWESTNGLQIYFGQNGIDLKEKKMISITEGERGRIIQRQLLTAIREKVEKSKKPDKVLGVEKKMATVSKNIEDISAKIQDIEIKIASISRNTEERNIPLHEQIHKNLLDDIRKDEYSLDVAPSDLIDFGGQKAFDMIHQLFLSQHGTVLLMFNGKYDLYDVLHEYSEKVTTAEILIHWVNSVLTYCTEQPDGMPVIQFVATRADLFEEGTQREKRKMELARQLDAIFGTHEKKAHLHYDPLFFINATDKCDEEIEKLKDKLVEVAFTQMHWGRDMPLAWVPLEKQISDLRHQGKNILHMEDLLALNDKNEEFAMDEAQLSLFLKSQHAFGKMLFFDQEELRNYVIIEPVFLVNVLKSFITDDLFFPKDQPEIATILTSLQTHGFISEHDLFKVWEQPEYRYLLQYKEYIVKILEMLGVIVTPKTFYTQKEVSFIVPSMVRATRDSDYISKNITVYKSICMRYVVRTAISRILFFRLTAAAIGIWPLQKHGERQMLFHGFATFDLDEDNEFSLCLKNDEIDVYFTHKKSVESIQPDYVASVQECLTSALKSIVEFYQTSFAGKKSENQIFQIQYGVLCIEGPCFCESENQPETATWDCRHDHAYDVKYLWYWESDKLKKKRIQNVSTADFSLEILNTQPPPELIQNIALAVGTTGGLLGLKLGLSKAVVQKMMFGKSKNIFQKTEKILDRWQLMSVDDTTIDKIIKTLLDIGGRGIETVTKFYQLKYTCKWIYGSGVENLPRRARSKSLPDLYLSHWKSTDREWFFKLKLFCDDKYDVHVINSHRIEKCYPGLEKFVDKKEHLEMVENPTAIEDYTEAFEALYKEKMGWTTYKDDYVRSNFDLACRFMLFKCVCPNRMKDILIRSMEKQIASIAKAASWCLIKNLLHMQMILPKESLTKIKDIWPGFSCHCQTETKGHSKICSTEAVIIIELNEHIVDLKTDFMGIQIIQSCSDQSKDTVKTSAEKPTCKPIENTTQPAYSKLSGEIVELYFKKHSKLTIIYISPDIPDCIQLYCRIKGVIPMGEDHFPKQICEFGTNVTEGHVQFMAKIKVGDCIGTTQSKGTLGGFVQWHGFDAFLTCAHVVYDTDLLIKRNNQKLHKGKVEVFCHNIGGNWMDTCGYVIEHVFEYGDSKQTSMDVALVLMNANAVPEEHAFLGLKQKYINDNYISLRQMQVHTTVRARSVGMVSGYSDVSIKCEDYDGNKRQFGDRMSGIKCSFRGALEAEITKVLASNPPPSSSTVTTMHFQNIIIPKLIENSERVAVRLYHQLSVEDLPFQAGDSGTCVYIVDDKSSGCMGMAIGSYTDNRDNKDKCIVTPIDKIMDRLGLLSV